MHVVSFDFQSDVTSCGRHIRFFIRLDGYTRTTLAVIPRRSFEAVDVVALLGNIIAETGTAPAYICCDNGPEFSAAALIEWSNTAGADTVFIDPSSPWQNGFIESFQAGSGGSNSPENHGHYGRSEVFGRGMENYLQS